MTSYFSSNFHNGLKIIFENEPYIIETSEFVKPGKGQAFVRVRMRRILTGRLVEKIFKSTESAKIADVVDVHLTYLYNDASLWYFMNDETFEQLAASSKVVGKQAKWLIDQIKCIVTLWDGNPISVTPPNFVELKVVETDPGIRGDTASTGNKLAKLSTGAIIKVPLFVQIGEIVKVDTRISAYVSRVK